MSRRTHGLVALLAVAALVALAVWWGWPAGEEGATPGPVLLVAPVGEQQRTRADQPRAVTDVDPDDPARAPRSPPARDTAATCR